jgi:hypothetical protein
MASGKFRRWFRRAVLALAIVVVLLALAILSALTIDLGPAFRERAERAASGFLERPTHIGRIGIHLLSGNFVVEDLRIDGPAPGDHPFFTAKKIVVDLPAGAIGSGWSFARTREFVIKSVEMTDWDMQIEMRDGKASLPNLKSKNPSGGKRNFRVTVQRVHAARGRFTFIDPGTWRTTSPNLDVLVTHDDVRGYTGRAEFSDGSVAIKDYLPMRSDMRCAFEIQSGGKVHLDWIDLQTDGAESQVSGDVDFLHWPEMLYRVKSHVHFPRMREIFFANEKFRLTGDGDFNGTFHIFKNGRDLEGSFSSPLATVNDYRFEDLKGELRWLPDRFDITRLATRFERGTARFTYSIAPIGAPRPAVARFDASYQNVDLASLTDFLGVKGLKLSGRASGRNVLAYPLGHFGEHRGDGEMRVEAPDGVQMYSRTSVPGPPAVFTGPIQSYVAPVPDIRVPVAAEVSYEYDPEWVDVAPGWISTPSTYAEFSGRTAYGGESEMNFFARSGDWQESDRLLAAVLTAFGSPTHVVVMGGSGEFNGKLTRSFHRPRIAGTFDVDNVRAFDVIWGHARGNVVVDNGYVDVTGGVVTQADAELHADGRFSLSTPRADGGEEIDAHVTLARWPVRDLRHAFELDTYPVEGKLGGEFDVHGAYRRPFGSGSMTMEQATVYGEPFDSGKASVRLEGVGIRLDGAEIAKAGGKISGAAYVSWDGNYSFTAKGLGIPMESLRMVQYPGATLYGTLSFDADGNGAFADPRYQIGNFVVADMFVNDEGIGQVAGEISVQNRQMGIRADVDGGVRLQASCSGRISMDEGADANLSLQVTDTSLDPYIRAFWPLSPFTRAIATGSVRVEGKLSDPTDLLVDATVSGLEMELFDYQVHNDGPMHLALENEVIHLGDRGADGAVRPMRFVGEDTRLDLSGDVDLRQRSAGVHASGDANLALLQGFFRDIRSSGHATLVADVQGPLDKPAFTGNATIENGRIRYSSLPAIDAINGPITFTAGAIRFYDPADPARTLRAQMGGGPITFGGLIETNGFMPSQLAITANGEGVRLRYPEGFTSVIDGELSLVGPYTSPTLKGLVTLRSGVYSKPLNWQLDVFQLAAAAGAGGESGTGAAPAGTTPFPIKFDVRVEAPSSLRVENNLARLVARASLQLRGTYDHPLLFGDAEIEHGYLIFLGKRYLVTHGVIEFHNPARIEPFFDFGAEVHARVPGQTYVIDLQVAGTGTKSFSFQYTSDPPLSQFDTISLLLGDVRSPGDVRNAELRSMSQDSAERQQMVQSRVEQLLFGRAYSEVNRAFEQTFGLTTFQLTPSLFDEYQRLSPTARLTVGKQISDRVYVTISRSLYSPQEDIIYFLEYDQSDRVSWVLSRNEDKTYALDVRVRHSF